MSKKMLIDAGHPEETRVVVLDGGRVEEFDYESSAKRQLRGNIYLAQVTRVEPSLQAAFVEYGGNRHGFLAFNEIHPDYYKIPDADRKALLEEEQAAHSKAAREEDDEPVAEGEAAEAGDDADENGDEAPRPRARSAPSRRYKIQEVIKRRQLLLVQVVKEERGNKGAALTTYLSLAGRYGVLMPNTARGGGISRKITSATDRKRLRKIVDEFDVPEGMGLIVRTAGAKRTKTEIKRDYESLMKLWTQIRERTLTSVAPCLIHEEDNLVKRAIRDLYDKDVESVLVEGDEAYREAKDFIRMLMPSHAKKVQPYKGHQPLFLRHGAEQQLEQIYNPTVTLKSGGYLVINQTEALVAIDVNSGRSTRERNIEATALKTNLEAAEEACRQFRLRDLAGLLVIDFIDMEESKNNRAVEKKMRDCLKRDRARVQSSKISSFGLMELSRQRRRANLLDGSHEACPTCKGRGILRSVESSALHVLRRIEEAGVKGTAAVIRVSTASDVALYMLNEKRPHLNAIGERYGMRVMVSADPDRTPPDCEIEVIESRRAEDAPIPVEEAPIIEDEPDIVEDIDEEELDEAAEAEAEQENAKSKRRRRRGRRGDKSAERASEDENVSAEADAEAETDAEADAEAEAVDGEENGDADSDGERTKKRRRRGRRGGRGRRSGSRSDAEPDGMRVVDPESESEAATVEAAADAVTEPAEPAESETPGAVAANAETEAEPAAASEDGDAAEAVAEPPAEKPKRRARPRRSAAAKKAAEEAEAAAAEAGAETAVEAETAPVAAPESAPEPELESAPEPEPEPVAAEAAEDEAEDEPRELEAAEPAGFTSEPDPDAEARRARWQDRLKTWLNN